MKIKRVVNKSNTDWQDSEGCYRPAFTCITKTELNFKWNSIIHFVSHEDVKHFEKIDNQYIVTYRDGQVWKFKGFDLVKRIEFELSIILKRYENKNSLFKKVKKK